VLRGLETPLPSLGTAARVADTRLLYSPQLILPVHPRITNAGGGNWFGPIETFRGVLGSGGSDAPPPERMELPPPRVDATPERPAWRPNGWRSVKETVSLKLVDEGRSVAGPSGVIPYPQPRSPPRDFGTPLRHSRTPCLGGVLARCSTLTDSSRLALSHPRHAHRRSGRFHNPADDDTIAEHVIVVVATLAAGDGLWWHFEHQAYRFTWHAPRARVAPRL
jgi:hypothetical protein